MAQAPQFTGPIHLKIGKNEVLHFVPIPAGTFEFQPDDAKLTRKYSMPVFWMLHTPLTQGQYMALMPQGTSNPSTYKGRSLPVTDISWLDINEQGGVIDCVQKKLDEAYPKQYHCRLPHEVEWEYVACYGDAQAPHYAMPVAWFDQNSYDQPMPVGAKPANALGLHDLSGNVWEWCCNESNQPNYPLDNPLPTVKADTRIALRGGAFWNPRAGVCARLRLGRHASDRSRGIGLRLCVSHQLPKQGG